MGVGRELGLLLKRLESEDCPIEPSGWHFEGEREDQEEYEKFVIDQTFLCLHGQQYTDTWKGIPFGNFIRKNEHVLAFSAKARPGIDDEDDIL